MTDYPDSFGARSRLREERESAGAQRGREGAIRVYSSIRCTEDNHAPDGCQNRGTTCLCSCHDAAPAQTEESPR